MKTIAALTLSLLALASVQTQILRADAVNGAIVGGIAGAIIGNNSGDHNALRGAAIGSVAGALIGSATDNSNHNSHGYYARPPMQVSVGYSSGYGYGHSYGYGHRFHGYRNAYGYGAYGYVPPVAYYSSYGYRRPSYASSGLFWGGLTGAIIGNNSHGHNAWRGAAVGAGAGLLIGAIADQDAREREERAAAILDAQTAAAAQNTPAQPAPQNVTIINNYNTPAPTPMSSANGMFGR